jgi:hypothetical protein
VGVIKKPESQQYQGLASPNKAITPTTPCKVGISQILCKALHFYFAINILEEDYYFNSSGLVFTFEAC